MPGEHGFTSKEMVGQQYSAVRESLGSSAMAKSASASAPPVVIIPRPKKTVASTQVLDSVKDKPRQHLGEFVYEVELSPARVRDPRTNRAPKFNWKSNPKPLPWNLIQDKENCTLTVKISKAHLTPSAREEITSRRALWGTEVYTDDSDVIAACIHGGWFRGEWAEDIDVDMLDLDRGPNADLNGTGGSRPTRQGVQDPNADPFILESPPETGPMHVPAGRDLHVKVLILPRLKKYASMARYGIKSREWGSGVTNGDVQSNTAHHDGLSFMVLSIEWLTNGAQPSSRVRGRARRDRINKALREIQSIGDWNANGKAANSSSVAIIQSGTARVGGTVISTDSWFKPAVRPSSEGNKENQPAVMETEEPAIEAPTLQPESVAEPLNGPEETGSDKPEPAVDAQPSKPAEDKTPQPSVGETQTPELAANATEQATADATDAADAAPVAPIAPAVVTP
jgi:hypothetical protein